MASQNDKAIGPAFPRHGPLVGRLFSVSRLHFSLSSAGPGCCQSQDSQGEVVFRRDMKAACPGAGYHLNTGWLDSRISLFFCTEETGCLSGPLVQDKVKGLRSMPSRW